MRLKIAGLRSDKLKAAATNDPTPTKSVILCVSRPALARKPTKLQPPITIPTCLRLEPAVIAAVVTDIVIWTTCRTTIALTQETSIYEN